MHKNPSHQHREFFYFLPHQPATAKFAIHFESLQRPSLLQTPTKETLMATASQPIDSINAHRRAHRLQTSLSGLFQEARQPAQKEQLAAPNGFVFSTVRPSRSG